MFNVIGGLLSYGFFFILNLIIQIFTGGLSEVFPADTMTM